MVRIANDLIRIRALFLHLNGPETYDYDDWPHHMPVIEESLEVSASIWVGRNLMIRTAVGGIDHMVFEMVGLKVWL